MSTNDKEVNRHLPIEHDLAHQHVFEWNDSLWTEDRVVAFKRLVEVRVGSLEVFLVGSVEDTCQDTQDK